MTTPVLWPAWFRYTITAAMSLALGAFVVGQDRASLTAADAASLAVTTELNARVGLDESRLTELEAWRRGEEAARNALSAQIAQVVDLNRALTLKIDDLARVVHRVEGAVLGRDAK